MIVLRGYNECKIDARGRLLFPSGFRKQLKEAVEKGFCLKRSTTQKCLELYPMEEWERLEAKLAKVNRFQKKNDMFLRVFNAGLKFIELDAHGRLQVAKDLVHFADLKKEIVLTSNQRIIEIWDKELYQASIDISPEEFAELSEEVLGALDFE